MKCIKNRQLLRLVAIFITIFAINILAMNVTKTEKETAAFDVMKLQQEENHENQYFIYEQGTDEGIWVNKELIEDNSRVIKSMIEDVHDESNKIPLDFPLDTIKLAFNVLNKKIKDINKLSLKQIISVANLFNYLDVPSDKLLTVLAMIKKNININEDYKPLKELHPDLQKLIMTQPAINYLKNFIIKKYVNNRKKSLDSHPIEVNSIAFNADGTKFVSGGSGREKTLILWDISNPENSIPQIIDVPQGSILSVALSPDGTKIAVGYDSMQNNLIICDISNPNNIINHTLADHPQAVFTVAFSPDSKQLLSGCAGAEDNLILWDISKLDNISHQTIDGCPGTVLSVAFNPHNDKQFASGGVSENNENNLILWNITDLNNVTHHAIEECPSTVFSVAFDSVGKHIVTSCDGDENNLIIWDISTLNAITSQPLIGHQSRVRSAMFNRNNTKIVSGSLDKATNNLILWDISNPNNITHQKLVGHTHSVLSVAFSPDNKYIISGAGTKNNLILWTLLTDQEELLLHQFKDYTADQIRLIYQLCIQASKKQPVVLTQDSDDYHTFTTLPQDMQNLLNALVMTNSEWLSRLWQTFVQRKV